MRTSGLKRSNPVRRIVGVMGLCAALSPGLTGLAAAANVVAEIRLCTNNAPVAGAQVSLVSSAPNCTPATCTIWSGSTDIQGRVTIPFDICFGDPDDPDFRIQQSGKAPVTFRVNFNQGAQITWSTTATSATGACSISGSGTPTLVVKVN